MHRTAMYIALRYISVNRDLEYIWGKFVSAFCMTIIFTIMHFAIIISASLDAKEATHIKLIDMNSLFNILLGLFLIIIGNFLPKTRKNSTVGIRTTWSMKNDETWSHSNRFAGKALVISGFIIVLTSAFTTAPKSTASASPLFKFNWFWLKIIWDDIFF